MTVWGFKVKFDCGDIEYILVSHKALLLYFVLHDSLAFNTPVRDYWCIKFNSLICHRDLYINIVVVKLFWRIVWTVIDKFMSYCSSQLFLYTLWLFFFFTDNVYWHWQIKENINPGHCYQATTTCRSTERISLSPSLLSQV